MIVDSVLTAALVHVQLSDDAGEVTVEISDDDDEGDGDLDFPASWNPHGVSTPGRIDQLKDQDQYDAPGTSVEFLVDLTDKQVTASRLIQIQGQQTMLAIDYISGKTVGIYDLSCLVDVKLADDKAFFGVEPELAASLDDRPDSEAAADQRDPVVIMVFRSSRNNKPFRVECTMKEGEDSGEQIMELLEPIARFNQVESLNESMATQMKCIDCNSVFKFDELDRACPVCGAPGERVVEFFVPVMLGASPPKVVAAGSREPSADSSLDMSMGLSRSFGTGSGSLNLSLSSNATHSESGVPEVALARSIDFGSMPSSVAPEPAPEAIPTGPDPDDDSLFDCSWHPRRARLLCSLFKSASLLSFRVLSSICACQHVGALQ